MSLFLIFSAFVDTPPPSLSVHVPLKEIFDSPALFTFEINNLDIHLSSPRFQNKQLPAAIEKKCPTVNKGGVVGTKTEDGNKVDLHGSIAPYLVVTPELSEDGKGGTGRTNLYALIVEKPAPNGLFLPTIVLQSKVFYLARDRNSSTTRDKRASEWNKLAAKEAFLLEPVLSLKNGIGFHVSSYLRTSETWHLQKVLALMEEADEDLKHMPAPSNTALLAFFDNENENFGEDDAEIINKEMVELWSGFEKISTGDLLVLKRQIMGADMFIEYKLLRYFGRGS
ncbi:uncharacterized protein EAE98_005264 [Botrytis deweyae]|uniref:Uncharacterized protein n=1 Tax=Botrytis deweyae TaxID=2478750 RepID=A0ABQ7IND9_9HELO|nr:uncharacterized protein EAE98_005264 [Botrytis deweyae]KAF7929346.1 hypothetical protein EAE98_005264 [Botrytis deweyae]